MRRPLFPTLVLLLILGCGSAELGDEWQRLQESVAAADFTLKSLDGQPVKLSEQQGKVVIMEFWATWCGPCRMSTPSLEVIYREHKDQPVMVLLVNAGESPEKIRPWVGKRFTAPILLDQDGRVAKAYGVRGIPQLFIIDPEGRIIYDHGGYQGGLERSLRRILEGLLAEREVAHDA